MTRADASPRLTLVWSRGGSANVTAAGRARPCHISDLERPAGRFLCDGCRHQLFIDGGSHVACTSPSRIFTPHGPRHGHDHLAP